MSGNKSNKITVWSILSSVSFGCGLFTFYKGIDKLTNYYNSDYSPYLNKNAYVGGDAYNYIINGTHSTAFFVLTAMLVLAAICLMILHYVSLSYHASISYHATISEPQKTDTSDELPNL